jgi:hypothetical protein
MDCYHLRTGDGAAVSNQNQLIVIGKEKAEVLLLS